VDEAPPTQFLPPYPAGGPSGGQAPGYPQQVDEAPPTQYMPPYPAGGPTSAPVPPPRQQAQQPGFPSHATAQLSGYPQGYAGGPGQPPSGGQQGGGYLQQQGFQQPDPRPSSGGRSRRPSGKVIAGSVVGVCAVVGILAGALLGGGGSDSADPAASASTGSQAATSAAATPGGGSSAAPAPAPAADPAVKAQAQALSGLLSTASSSRGAVIAAVGAIRGCGDLSGARQSLIQAAGQRRQLVTSLTGLKVDKLPNGAQLSAQLGAAWQASARADEEYAAWAVDSVRSCRKHHQAAGGGHLSRANEASGVATGAKKTASRLWNPIAAKNGLPARSYTQL
jgi:hypothetical protein